MTHVTVPPGWTAVDDGVTIHVYPPRQQQTTTEDSDPAITNKALDVVKEVAIKAIDSMANVVTHQQEVQPTPQEAPAPTPTAETQAPQPPVQPTVQPPQPTPEQPQPQPQPHHETPVQRVDRIQKEVLHGTYRVPQPLRIHLEGLADENDIYQTLQQYSTVRRSLIDIATAAAKPPVYAQVNNMAARVALREIPVQQAEEEYRNSITAPSNPPEQNAGEVGTAQDAVNGLLAGLGGVQ